MEHVTSAHYDGEGVYAWSCSCGDGESDYVGLDEARADGALHELDEAITASEAARAE